MSLFVLYKSVCVLLYLWLSALLLYHRLFTRWLRFSLGFFIVYVFGSYFFFGVLPEIFAAQELMSALPYVLFYLGTPLLLGFLLLRQLLPLQIIGVLISFLSILGLLLVVTTNYYDRPFGFVYELTPHARAWLEIGSVLLLAIAALVALGYCFASMLTWSQTFGAFIMFLGLVVLVVSLVWLTIGYEFLGKALRSSASLFLLASTR